jgi:hypothetical protein
VHRTFLGGFAAITTLSIFVFSDAAVSQSGQSNQSICYATKNQCTKKCDNRSTNESIGTIATAIFGGQVKKSSFNLNACKNICEDTLDNCIEDAKVADEDAAAEAAAKADKTADQTYQNAIYASVSGIAPDAVLACSGSRDGESRNLEVRLWRPQGVATIDYIATRFGANDSVISAGSGNASYSLNRITGNMTYDFYGPYKHIQGQYTCQKADAQSMKF